MVFASIALFGIAFLETPKEALESAIKHYQNLSSYSVTIECHDASGLFPGNYEQTLKWKKGGRFEIIVTKKSDYVPKPDAPGFLAQDYFSNGKDVLTRRPDGPTSIRSVEVDANTSPGWEVTTGLVLSWLQKSGTSRYLVDPPEGFKIDLAWGDQKEWTGVPIREIVVAMTGQSGKLTISLFLSTDKPEIIGYEFQENGKHKWLRYRDAKNNPDLPATLGDHPK